MMSLLCSTADAIRSGCWTILFKVLTLNVTIGFVLFFLGNVCLNLISVAYFSKTEARDPPSTERTQIFLSLRRVI